MKIDDMTVDVTARFTGPEEAILRDIRLQVVTIADHLEKVGLMKDAARLAAYEVVIFGKKDEYLRVVGAK